jgi:hypothetical protein
VWRREAMGMESDLGLSGRDGWFQRCASRGDGTAETFRPKKHWF